MTDQLEEYVEPGTMRPLMEGELCHYELGNALRGTFSGYFNSDTEAWNALSDQFNRSFPSRSGRTVVLSKTVAHGRTAGGNETDRDRKMRLEHERILAEDREERGE